MGGIPFDFDPKEGLGDGFLTPVYFDNEVLVKHLYSKTIAVEFASETYGTIYWPTALCLLASTRRVQSSHGWET